MEDTKQSENKLALTNYEIELKDNQIIDIHVGDLLISSYDVKEVTSIEKEGDYVRFKTKGNRYNNDSVGVSDIKSYYSVLKGYKLEDLENIADSVMAGTFNPENFKEKEDKNIYPTPYAAGALSSEGG
jgi:hypothetical protein